MKQFEVESLKDFVAEIQSDQKESPTKIQYITNMKSVEVHEIFPEHQGSSEEKGEEPKVQEVSININDEIEIFEAKQGEQVNANSEGPSSKFLQHSFNRLSHLQQLNFEGHNDISDISFLNQAQQLLAGQHSQRDQMNIYED